MGKKLKKRRKKRQKKPYTGQNRHHLLFQRRHWDSGKANASAIAGVDYAYQ